MELIELQRALAECKLRNAKALERQAAEGNDLGCYVTISVALLIADLSEALLQVNDGRLDILDTDTVIFQANEIIARVSGERGLELPI